MTPKADLAEAPTEISTCKFGSIGIQTIVRTGAVAALVRSACH